MIDMLKNLHKEESGQDLIEYALIAALIAVACVASMQALATKITAEFTKVGGSLT
jgi:pilus assembly protein Flp/PilA